MASLVLWLCKEHNKRYGKGVLRLRKNIVEDGLGIGNSMLRSDENQVKTVLRLSKGAVMTRLRENGRWARARALECVRST